VTLLQGLGSTLPSFSFEGRVLAKAQLDALAEASEEGSFVGRSPAEARSSSISVNSGRCLAVGAEHNIAVVFGHGRSDWSEGGVVSRAT
jgi:hypothetical protein